MCVLGLSELIDSVLTFPSGYDTLEYSWVKATAISVRYRDVTKYQQKSGLLWAMTEVREAALSIKDIPLVCLYSDFFFLQIFLVFL